MLYTVQTKCGKYDLNIIGNPDKLLVIPIKHIYGIDITLRDRKDYSTIYDVHGNCDGTMPQSMKESPSV